MKVRYRGPLRAVIFDWAGTIVDFGSRAPMDAIVDVFARRGIALTEEEVRGPMGLAKLDHFRVLGRLPRVVAKWTSEHGGRVFSDDDARALLQDFVPANRAAVIACADLIPGAIEAIADVRARGLKVGSTTGYTREIMAVLAPEAEARGYRPDCLVCADDVAVGRPSPLMMYRCFLDLEVYPAAACVKLDDTAPGIAEGLAAGSWTVGVAVSGNAFGLSEQETAALPRAAYEARRSKAVTDLARAGAHLVIDSVNDLSTALNEVDARLEKGEQPG